jgi:hypothetical protein
MAASCSFKGLDLSGSGIVFSNNDLSISKLGHVGGGTLSSITETPCDVTVAIYSCGEWNRAWNLFQTSILVGVAESISFSTTPLVWRWTESCTHSTAALVELTAKRGTVVFHKLVTIASLIVTAPLSTSNASTCPPGT